MITYMMINTKTSMGYGIYKVKLNNKNDFMRAIENIYNRKLFTFNGMLYFIGSISIQHQKYLIEALLHRDKTFAILNMHCDDSGIRKICSMIIEGNYIIC